MLITGFAAGMFQTNCYVLAPAAGGECVIVDPGQDAMEALTSLVAEHGLTPTAVLVTHGHLDHTWSVAPACAHYGVPAYVHPDDRPMLADPAIGMGSAMSQIIGDATFEEPAEVIEVGQDAVIETAGMRLTTEHTPGHTRGSICLRTPVATEAGTVEVVLTGDTLFAGSIGRSDLPGGNHQQLLDSIAARLLPLPDDAVILPGHGGTSTIGRERAANPFLTGLTPG